MIKVLFWVAGDCGFLYAIYRFSYWHEAAAMMCLSCAALWIFGGAALIGARLRQYHKSPSNKFGDSGDLIEAARRASVEQHGKEGH
jgi:hypothetical protein